MRHWTDAEERGKKTERLIRALRQPPCRSKAGFIFRRKYPWFLACNYMFQNRRQYASEGFCWHSQRRRPRSRFSGAAVTSPAFSMKTTKGLFHTLRKAAKFPAKTLDATLR